MKRALTSANVRLAFEVVLLTAVLLLILARSTPSEAAPNLSNPSAPTATYWYLCNSPDQVAVFTNRVHVHCASVTTSGGPAMSGITWFAVPTSPDSASASRFMSIFQSAMLSGRQLWLFVDPSDTSGGSFGCGTSDCRRLAGAEMK